MKFFVGIIRVCYYHIVMVVLMFVGVVVVDEYDVRIVKVVFIFTGHDFFGILRWWFVVCVYL